MSLFAVRHAPVLAEGLCYGRKEVDTAVGHDAAARTILEQLREQGDAVDRVWSSPSSRCREPARLLSAELRVPHRESERLCEIDYGEWEGRAWDALETDDAERLHRWMNDWESAAPPGGETVAALEERVRGWLREERPVGLLVGHGGVIRALRVLCEGVSWSESMSRPVPHLEIERFDARLASV